MRTGTTISESRPGGRGERSLLKQPREVRDLEWEVGRFIKWWGFKSVHGRIWLCLFLSSEPIDAKRLIQLLRISKALASISLKELQLRKVIRKVGKGAKGTQLYEAHPDALLAISVVLQTREAVLIERIQACVDRVNRLDEKSMGKHRLSRERLRILGGWVLRARRTLGALPYFSGSMT